MAFGNSVGRARGKTQVFLNVYDLSPANDILYTAGLGLHHSGIEIMGTEYSFASGSGIFEGTPKQAAGAKFRVQLELGSYEGGMQELNRAIDELRDEFRPDSYNLVRRNCNHFSNAISWKLLRQRIPSYVNRLADVGNCCSCILPKKMLEEAPVGHSGSESSRSFAVPTNATMQRADNKKGTTTTPSIFSGTGHTLGASGSATSTAASSTSSSLSAVGGGFFSSLTSSSRSSTTSGAGSTHDDLTDRREKARRAALARFERNSNKEAQD